MDKLRISLTKAYNSNTETDKETDPLKIACVMNILELNDDTTSFKVFNCNSCEGKPHNICQICFEKCHAFHNINMKGVTETLTYMSITKCSCALKNHEVILTESCKDHVNAVKKTSKYVTRVEKVSCNLNQYLKNSINYAYRLKKIEDKSKSGIFCIYCIDHCYNNRENLENLYEIVPINSVINYSCSCQVNNNHFPFFENVNNLKNLIESKDELFSNIEKISIPSTILNTPENLYKIFNHVTQYHDIIIEKIDSNNVNEIQKEPLTKAYTTSLRLLKSFEDCFPGDYFYIKNEEIQKYYNFEFLEKIFTSQPQKNDNLIILKIQTLLFFRLFYILPLIKFVTLENLGNFENISPAHRMLYRMNINQFLKLINLDRKMTAFFDLLKIISDQIINYYKKVDEERFIFFSCQYLELVKILVAFNYEGDDFEYLLNIIAILKELMCVFSLKASYKNSIHILYEDIIFHIMINLNDKNYFKMFMIGLVGDSQPEPQNSGKNFQIKYCFQTSELTNDLIYCLFSFKIEENERNYLKNKKFYDLLINRHDSYSESIKSLLETNGVALVAGKELNDMMMNDIEVTGSSGEIYKKEEYETLKNLFDIIINRKQEYYDGAYRTEEFINFIKSDIDNFFKYLSSITTNILGDGSKLLLKQIFLVKLGLFDHLFKLWNVLSLISETLKRRQIVLYEYNKNFESEVICNENFNLSNINLIFETVIDILSIIVLNNETSFMIPMVFTDHAIKLFLKYCNNKVLDFYYRCTHALYKKQYKLDFTTLINHLMDISKLDKLDSNILDNLQESYLLLKIFKNCLKNANSKSIEMVNSKIAFFVKKIISSINLKDDLNEIFREEAEPLSPKIEPKLNNNKNNNNKKNHYRDMNNLHLNHISINSDIPLIIENNLKNLDDNLHPLEGNVSVIIDNLSQNAINENILEDNLLNMMEDNTQILLSNERIILKKRNLNLIFQLINYLSNYSFINITPHIDSSALEKIIYSSKIKIDLKTRLILTSNLYRYFLESPYFILKLNKNIVETGLRNFVDVNLIGRINSYNEEVRNILKTVHQNTDIHIDAMTHENIESDVGLIISPSPNADEGAWAPSESDSESDSVLNTRSNADTCHLAWTAEGVGLDADTDTDALSINYDKIFNIGNCNRQNHMKNKIYEKDLLKTNFQIYGLGPILFNLKKFPKIFKDINNTDNKNYCTNNLMKYFNALIFCPSMLSLYKLVFYSESFNIKIKYLMFVIVQLYLKCFNHFLDMLLDKINKTIFKNKSIIFSKTSLVLKIFKKYIDLEAIDKISYHDEQNNLNETSNSAASLNESKINSNYNKIKNCILKLKNITQQNINDLDIITINIFNFETILNKFENVGKYWVPYDKIKNENVNFNEKFKLDMSKKVKTLLNDKSSLFRNIFKIYTDYIEKKGEFTCNVFFNLFEHSSTRLENIKKNVAMDLIFSLEEPKTLKNSISTFNENNSEKLESLIRVFKVDPDLFQNMLVSSENSNEFVSNLITELPNLIQYVFIEFSRLTKREFYSYDNFLNILEFLRLLCENHNKIFQVFLMNYVTSSHGLNLMYFLINLSHIVLNYIDYFIKKKPVFKYFKNLSPDQVETGNASANIKMQQEYDPSTFFNNLISNLHDFYIEILQGAVRSNFKTLLKEANFTESYINQVNAACILYQKEKIFFLAHSFRYLNSIFEEKNNIYKQEFENLINPKLFLELCLEAFKKMLSLKLENSESKSNDSNYLTFFKKPFSNHTEIQTGYAQKLLEILMRNSCANSDEGRSENNNYSENTQYDILFLLSSEIFKLLKLLAKDEYNLKCKHEVQTIFSNFNEISQPGYLESIKKNEKIFKQTKGKIELFHFFNTLIKDIEVNFVPEKFVINEEDFSKYEFLFYNEDEKLDMSPVLNNLKDKLEEDENEEQIENVIFMIDPHSLHMKDKDHDKLVNTTYKYYSDRKLNYLLDYCQNDLSTVIRMREIFYGYCKNSKIFDIIINLDYFILTNFSTLLTISINTLMTFTLFYPNNSSTIINNHFLLIFSMSLFNLSLVVLLIANFLYFENYKLTKIIYPRLDPTQLTREKYILDFLHILTKDEIYPLIWIFVFGFLGILKREWNYFYALQSFAIFFVNPTMKVVLSSIMLRYKQFISAIFGIFLTILFFSSLTFYFFRSEFGDVSDDNICNSYFQCFVSISNFGLRAGSIGLPLHSTTYKKYWNEFVLDWLFYVLVILILLNVINGIIVDTFQELREENVRIYDLSLNSCLICSLKRSKFEIKGRDFDEHVSKEHNYSNYFHYIFKIRRSDRYNLNAIDSHVLKCLEARKVDFLPIKTAKNLPMND